MMIGERQNEKTIKSVKYKNHVKKSILTQEHKSRITNIQSQHVTSPARIGHWTIKNTHCPFTISCAKIFSSRNESLRYEHWKVQSQRMSQSKQEKHLKQTHNEMKSYIQSPKPPSLWRWIFKCKLSKRWWTGSVQCWVWPPATLILNMLWNIICNVPGQLLFQFWQTEH